MPNTQGVKTRWSAFKVISNYKILGLARMLETLTENKKQTTKNQNKPILILSLVEFMILGTPELGKGIAHGRKSSPALLACWGKMLWAS